MNWQILDYIVGAVVALFIFIWLLNNNGER